MCCSRCRSSEPSRRILQSVAQCAVMALLVLVLPHDADAADDRFTAPSLISTPVEGVECVRDGDGELDLVSASPYDDCAPWHKSLDGKGASWKTRDAAKNLREAASVVTGDGHGDADVISGAMHADTVASHRNDRDLKPPKATAVTIKDERPVFDFILFDFDKSVLKPEGKTAAAKVVAWLKKYPKDTAVIEGHTCSIGTDEYNLGLGQRRADAVKCFLVEQGIEAKRLTAKSLGESRPSVPNDSPGHRKLNRRVAFYITVVE